MAIVKNKIALRLIKIIAMIIIFLGFYPLLWWAIIVVIQEIVPVPYKLPHNYWAYVTLGLLNNAFFSIFNAIFDDDNGYNK